MNKDRIEERLNSLRHMEYDIDIQKEIEKLEGMKDLFGNQTIRTLGLYQPYATLMLHGKIETRWVIAGRKPPFPLGPYLIYSTKKEYKFAEVKNIAGLHIYESIRNIAIKDESIALNGYALAIGELVKVREMTAIDMHKAFVNVSSSDDLRYTIGEKSYIRYALIFKAVARIEPFQFRGKQGVGILTDEFKKKIKIIKD